ncbi:MULTISPECIES: FKBP-type peptidyl-prolyl cis-trans isomerase [unclassified Agrococcus]|uniref:FKBP-type peptidyl-prolyl cis-trans isomerase n=1 Tax=unclassified Agrococcus TaxID=2615065 RepID=UPI00361E0E3A
MTKSLRRPLTAVATLLVVGSALTACHVIPSEVSIAGCTPSIQPGGASNGVRATSDATPTDVPFDTPLASDETQASISGATDDPAAPGDVVVADYTLYDGTTGEVLESTDQTLLRALADDSGDEMRPASAQLTLRTGGETVLSQGLECATADSTVALVAPFADLFGESVAQSGIDPASTAVLLLDVEDTFAGRAEGFPQPAVGGIPAIAIAPDGTPGLTFPSTAAPTELTVATTIQGDGAEVGESDEVVVQYTLAEWGADEVTETTWGSAPARFTLDELIPGFQQAVTGQDVGSQVVAVVPPELGYQDGRTLVFVIDILDAEAP